MSHLERQKINDINMANPQDLVSAKKKNNKAEKRNTKIEYVKF